MMTYYTLPGDTLSSIAAKRWAELAAPDLDAGVDWLCFTNPQLLVADIPEGTAYTITPWQSGGIRYA